jgi:hypothetical protein
MNFIGNRAIVLGDDSSIPQISYFPSFTAISFFMPIIVIFLAFVAIGSNDKIGLIRLSLGGLLSGLGIVGYICFNLYMRKILTIPGCTISDRPVPQIIYAFTILEISSEPY